MQLSSDPGHGPPEAFPPRVLYIAGSMLVFMFRGLLVVVLLVGCTLLPGGTTNTPYETF